ncbi:hypothetical protein SRHO_G00342520 [Serrasalmus rhombeus]
MTVLTQSQAAISVAQKVVTCGESAGLTRIRIRSESYLGPRGGLALKFSWDSCSSYENHSRPRGGLALKFSWATHDF